MNDLYNETIKESPAYKDGYNKALESAEEENPYKYNTDEYYVWQYGYLCGIGMFNEINN